MLKKISILLLASCCLIVLPFSIQAAEKHVTDCLNENEDCLKTEEPTGIDDRQDNDKELTESSTFKTSSLLFNIVKMVFALLLVLALIYVLLLFIKKRNRLFDQVGILENVGGISVGQNKSIQIVRIGSKMYLVGVGDNVELLEELTDEDVKESLLNKEETTLGPPSFLKGFLQKKTTTNKQHDETKNDDAFTNKLQTELNKLKANRHQMIDYYEKKDDKHV